MRETLLSAYENNISPRLKTELCNSDVNNYNYTKDTNSSNYYALFLSDFQFSDEQRIDSETNAENYKTEQWCTSWWHQFKVLLQRGVRERRFEAFNKLRIFQVISVAFLGGLLWWHTPTSHIADRVRILISFLEFISIITHASVLNMLNKLCFPNTDCIDLLLLGVLGVLPTIQRCLHISSRKNNAY